METASRRTQPSCGSLRPTEKKASEDGVADAAYAGPIQEQSWDVDLHRRVDPGDASSPQAIRVVVAEAVRMPSPMQAVPSYNRLWSRSLSPRNTWAVYSASPIAEAMIQETNTEFGISTISATRPPRRLGYTTSLRSMTKGRGRHHELGSLDATM